MKRGQWAALQPELLAHSKLGVIRVATLMELEISSETAYRRCQLDGPWRRLLPGIVLLHNGPPTRDQLVTAALIRSGEKALVTGPEACRRYRLRDVPPGTDVNVLLPHNHRVQSCDYLVVERTHRLPPPRYVDGFPLAPPVRAVLDTCRRIKDFDSVTSILTSAVQRGLCTPSELSDELTLGSPRGTAVPRRVLADLEQLRSVAERDALLMSRRIGLTTEHWNKTIVSQDGAFIGRPDAWFDDVGMAWEIDSKQFHFEPDDYARTLDRNTRYASAGILVVQTLPSRLRTDPDGVANELLSTHRAAADRPRPPVRVL